MCFKSINNKYIHSCDLFLSFLKVLWARVIWLNLLIENPLNISCPWKFSFENLHSFFHFFFSFISSCYQNMTNDNNGYLWTLHSGNGRHHAWAISEPKGQIRSSHSIGWKIEREAWAKFRLIIIKKKKKKTIRSVLSEVLSQNPNCTSL